MDSTSLVVFAATSVFMVSLTLGAPWFLREMPLFFCGASYTDIRIEKIYIVRIKAFCHY